MEVGKVLPKGFLPVFSVDTEEEARLLVVTTCPRGYDNHYYARELAQEQTLENLATFSDRLNEAHQRLVDVGRCTCKPVPEGP